MLGLAGLVAACGGLASAPETPDGGVPGDAGDGVADAGAGDAQATDAGPPPIACVERGFWDAEHYPCDPASRCNGRGRCVRYGDPRVRWSVPELCLCQPGYAGATCEGCAPGFAPWEGGCVDACRAAGTPCRWPFVCAPDASPPRCVCRPGRIGERCDQCAPGFTEEVYCSEDGEGCQTDCTQDCRGCRADQRCTILDGAGGCRCGRAYTAAPDGCRWSPPGLDDPGFDRQCRSWTGRSSPENVDSLWARVQDGAGWLHLEGFGRASLETPLRLPTAEQLPHGALTFTMTGSRGSLLEVGLLPGLTDDGAPPDERRPRYWDVGEPWIAGTGAPTRVRLCLPAPVDPDGYRLLFSMSQGWSETGYVVHDVRLDDVRIEAAPDCLPGHLP